MSLEDLIMLNEKIEKLEAGNEKLRKALEFYADKVNWDNNLSYAYTSIVNDYGDHVDGTCKGVVIGGKLARQTLEELK